MSDIDFELVKTGNGYSNDLTETAAKFASDTKKAVQRVGNAASDVEREVGK